MDDRRYRPPSIVYRPTQTMKPSHLLPLILFIIALALMSAIALRHAPMPARPIIARTTPLPAVTPTATATPGWWDEVDFATPTLPKLPGVKKPAFSGGVAVSNLP